MSKPKALNREIVEGFCFAHQTESVRNDSVKTEYDESQGPALAESDEEAVETSLRRSFADGSETISGYFCGSVR